MGTVYKLEQHLNDICKESPEYGDLLATWNINKKSYTEALKPIMQNYSHYTEHGDAHSEAILANIELLLGEEQIRKLSPTDTWMILQAAYLHDLGMSLMCSKIEEDWETEEFQQYLKELEHSADAFLREGAGYLRDLRQNLDRSDFEKSWPLQIRRYTTVIVSDYYRKFHGELSQDYIYDLKGKWGISLDFNGLIQNRLIVLLGAVAYLHTQEAEEVMKLDYMSNGHNADYIHPRFVAEMIRMGDLLDADNNRNNPYLHKAIGTIPESSSNHVKKHNSTRHILITPDLIEFRADCENPKIYRETRNFISWLVSETDFLNREWTAIVPREFLGHAPRLGKTEVLLNGKPDLNGVTDLRFEISQEKAFDLIEGSNLYEDRYIFIREVIQNAMDACKIQMWRDLKNGKYDAWVSEEVRKELTPFEVDSKIFENYKVTVEMKNVGQELIEVKISDNGTGISVETLKQMCNVGASYWERKKLRREIDEMPLWLKPTAGFGIGLQSIFLVTDKFEIVSKSENEEIHATVESRKQNGYVQISNSGTGRNQGTDIILYIPQDENFRFSFSGETVKYFTEKYDPFGGENRSLQYKILDVIAEHCGNTYFPIETYVEAEKALTIEPKRFAIADEGWEKEENYYYKMGNDRISMEMWDLESCTFFSWKIGGIRHYVNECLFKGMKTNNGGSHCKEGIQLEMDTYGLETRESLTLSRKKLTDSALEKIGTLCDRSFAFYKAKLLEKFAAMEEDIFQKEWGDSDRAEELFVFWSVLDGKERKCMIEEYPNRFQQVPLEVETFCVDKEKRSVNLEKRKFYDVVKQPDKIAYVNLSDIVKVPIEQQKNEDLQCVKEILERSIDRIPAEYIIVDERLCRELKSYGISNVSIVEDEKTILFFSICESDEDCCVRVDEEVKQFILQFLGEKSRVCDSNFWYGDTRRKFIPVFYDYKELAVKRRIFGMNGMTFPQTAILISPILPEDEACRNSMEKELWAENILQRRDFERLVDYVYENQVKAGTYSKEVIVKKYKELIQEYYEIAAGK